MQGFSCHATPHIMHAQYDWTTGVPDNGNEWRKFRAVPRSYPIAFPCFVLCLIGVETEGLLDYQGMAGIISIVRWNLRPVIFGVDIMPYFKLFVANMGVWAVAIVVRSPAVTFRPQNTMLCKLTTCSRFIVPCMRFAFRLHTGAKA